MTILDQIIENKFKEVQRHKEQKSVHDLKKSIFFSGPTFSLTSKLKNAPGIIAEFKRRSPSKGIIREEANVLSITQAYEQAGASACSILTDELFFNGMNQDIIDARPLLNIPILRKEFIVDAYQIIEAKALGADLILLIAECLSKDQVKDFTHQAHDLGLEVLMELHVHEELDKWNPDIDLLGINNRNLKSFETGIHRSLDIASSLPVESIWVSESGLQGSSELNTLLNVGYRGFLIGETFMKADDPGEMCEKFVMDLENYIEHG